MENENPKTVQQRVDEYEKLLESYTSGLALSKIRHTPDVEPYLSLTHEQIRSMSEEELGEVAILLSYYALYIQKNENRQKAINRWVVHALDQVVNKQLSQFGNQFVSVAEKRAKIIQSDSVATSLNKILVYSEGFAGELAFISQGLKSLVETIKDYRRSRRGVNQ